MPLSQLESRLRYEFRNAELLRQALTHRSHSATHNERLEFLGDSVLNCAVAALLFQRFSKLDEGDLSRVRANLVKQQSLYEIAQALNISEGLRLGEGELRSGGFRRPSILADAFEAIIGAVFLDGGFEAAQGVIKRLYIPILDHIDPRTLGKDAKTLLQEYLQGHKIALPTYTVVATHGAAHNQQFEVECTVPKLDVKVSGSGASRRAAEQAAAKKALDEVLAAAPMLAAKPKRSKNARGSKHVEPEIVPGVKGVQEALDLRSPERKERAAARDAKAAAAASAAADAGAQPGDRPAQAPMAAIRAAHVDTAADKADRPAKPTADKPGEKPADKATDKPSDKPADRSEPGARAADKPAERTDKPAEGAPRAADKPAGQATDPAVSSADKPAAGSDAASRATPRARDAAAPGPEAPQGGASLAAAQARVADADH
ncbi:MULTISPECIES: ribonuclease III [unclassified Burkholderia]|uniref:ribonuclease III n=1 Tax=unclassified Burkholderia TaxID=2613784 RepID=UPI000F56B3AE|nr:MULTISPECIES: ribonuclease III [unclassified Burkholderia]RQR41891.1 ribonuclease III [Burkholderia sp. Bp9131]RQR71436.1 ribonuclease III [Burkholderia sp. Bp9015]RQR81485.1 ribonuclease III [Burkholderia sp. Bp9011]RQR91062.1 ribonuclease III [Burkholderia sp. Bp9010]RQR94060.1 ribonuclease III [Burkholderia sp. Bp8994]